MSPELPFTEDMSTGLQQMSIHFNGIRELLGADEYHGAHKEWPAESSYTRCVIWQDVGPLFGYIYSLQR